ncbi:MAG TPA: type II secretion system protein [Thermotogota bacterium]|nr:type II secretion system protein [Thermotogota bacterium]
MNKRKGFGIVELVAAMAIFAIVTATVVFLFALVLSNVKRHQVRMELQDYSKVAAQTMFTKIQNATEVSFPSSVPSVEKKSFAFYDGDKTIVFQDDDGSTRTILRNVESFSMTYPSTNILQCSWNIAQEGVSFSASVSIHLNNMELLKEYFEFPSVGSTINATVVAYETKSPDS